MRRNAATMIPQVRDSPDDREGVVEAGILLGQCLHELNSVEQARMPSRPGSGHSDAAPPVDRSSWLWEPGGPLGLPAAAREVVQLLADLTGMRTWYVGRFIGEAALPLAVTRECSWLRVGEPLPWHETICRRMVTHLGPVVASDLSAVPNYSHAPLARRHGIRSYAGVPLLATRDRLLGVLAGWDDRPVGEFPPLTTRALWLFARLLTPLLESALEKDMAQFRADREDVRRRMAETLTRVPGRRGWGLVLDGEEGRGRRHGRSSAIIVVDLGFVRSARLIQRGTQIAADAAPDAVVARLSGRHVGILVDGAAGIKPTARAVIEELRAAGYAARAGWACRSETLSLRATWMLAESRLNQLRKPAS